MAHLGGPVDRDRLPRVHRIRLADPWWFVITEEPGGPAVGTIGIWATEHAGEPIHETGWMVAPEHQGRGIASRALALLIERARSRSRPSRASTPSRRTDNPASNALCRKAGFEHAGEVDVEFAGPPAALQPLGAGRQRPSAAATSAAARAPLRSAPSISALHAPAVCSPAKCSAPTGAASASSSPGAARRPSAR